jgi:hypothetical protein
MRKLLVGLFVMALAVPAAAQAQSFEIIAQIGGQLGKYSGDDVVSGTDFGFNAGGKVRLGGGFYVDGGVFWGANGGSVESGGTTDDVVVSGVRFPVTAGFRILRAAILDLRIYGGGVLDIASSLKDNDFGIVKDDVKSSIFSGRVGAGLDFTLIALDFGYEFGLSDVFEDSAGLGGVKRNGWFGEAGLRFAI